MRAEGRGKEISRAEGKGGGGDGRSREGGGWAQEGAEMSWRGALPHPLSEHGLGCRACPSLREDAGGELSDHILK
jgi:hypothetical protein